MGKAEDLLAEQLEEKESEIEDLKNELERVRSSEWTAHTNLTPKFFGIKKEELELTLPRIQVIVKEQYREWVWIHGIVYQHFAKDYVFVPLDKTVVNPGNRDGSYPDLLKFEEYIHDLPFRQGAHIIHDMLIFKLKAFIRIERENSIEHYEIIQKENVPIEANPFENKVDSFKVILLKEEKKNV